MSMLLLDPLLALALTVLPLMLHLKPANVLTLIHIFQHLQESVLAAAVLKMEQMKSIFPTKHANANFHIYMLLVLTNAFVHLVQLLLLRINVSFVHQ